MRNEADLSSCGRRSFLRSIIFANRIYYRSYFCAEIHFFHVTFVTKNIHVDERRRCANFISRGIRNYSCNHDLGVSDDSSTSSCISPLKISMSEGPIFHVYLPHWPKSALGCAGVLVSRFKMKIGPLIRARCRDKKKKKPRASAPSGSGSWKKKPFSSSWPLTCTFITLYCCRAKHPASRAAHRDLTLAFLPRPPKNWDSREQLDAFSHPERDEGLTWQLPRKITDLTKDLHLGPPRLPKG